MRACTICFISKSHFPKYLNVKIPSFSHVLFTGKKHFIFNISVNYLSFLGTEMYGDMFLWACGKRGLRIISWNFGPVHKIFLETFWHPQAWNQKLSICAIFFFFFFKTIYKVLTRDHQWNSIPSKSMSCIFLISRHGMKLKLALGIILNTLRANPTKWSNTLKQFVGCWQLIAGVCLTILWGWCLKGQQLISWLKMQ